MNNEIASYCTTAHIYHAGKIAHNSVHLTATALDPVVFQIFAQLLGAQLSIRDYYSWPLKYNWFLFSQL
jgi:hypothetical protein